MVMGERGREEGSDSSGGDETDGMNVKNNLDLSVCGVWTVEKRRVMD